ncbi:MAG: peptide ABC transporter permease [Deltaproteobacteria bacterium GWC2_55_46]|nr:MAG: peptide ABC transporter permease [Deltaproteobacteria bacterium GWA2_55_82]OGQ64320.1 MAG: peptide ABC transporter permease [Deltaproteobacteria bacterium RIFCSPLOWO2_02_FULL_55_12]OIJ74334.1 MAG: peptide ABC transporter permease [Deltaproteobacteria bacterium GWC2_55_46]HCY10966.1 peptide ABC transporter permease [Deltaproteobacteria bacterium]
MLAYIIRRILYAIPIVVGVNVLTALLFFYINTPDDMARKILGEKNVTPAAIENWKRDHGYNLPSFVNTKEEGLKKVTETVFFQKSLPLLWFDFGRSDRNNIDIGHEIRTRMWASLAISVPMFMAGLVLSLFFAMILAYYRATYIDIWGIVLAVIVMSISTLFYIIGGQYVLGKLLRLFPVSGYDTGLYAAKFIVLPVVIGIAASIGVGVRFYRTVFLEEINKDYVRTARAKGLTEGRVLFKHALKNAMIPVLTNVVVSIPFLFYGSLIMETFFAIPGLGNFTIEAIQSQDFAIVRSMVYLGSILYIIGLILTDISYTLVDPRIRFE